MSWNYRIILHDLDPDPSKHWYGLHEVFYGMPDDPSKPGVGPTANPISFVCGVDEGKEGIIGALELALKNLRDPRWGVVLTDSGMAQGISAMAEPTQTTGATWHNVPDFWLQKGLSIRAANALANGGIRDLDDLRKATRADLLAIPNFGRKSLREVQECTGWPRDTSVDPKLRDAVERFVREFGDPQDEEQISRKADKLIGWFRSQGWIKESQQ